MRSQLGAFADMVVGLLGAMVGSFLNVVIHRVPLGESIVAPRSRCPRCETQIARLGQRPDRLVAGPAGALPPLRGADLRALPDRGGAHRAHLPRGRADARRRRRPALELPFVAMLIAVAGIDLDHRIVPNKILLPAAVWAVAAGAVLLPGRAARAG